jgi:hypothetical protein
MSFDLGRTSAWTGLTLIRASNAHIANVAARIENITFMTLSLIHLLLIICDLRSTEKVSSAKTIPKASVKQHAFCYSRRVCPAWRNKMQSECGSFACSHRRGRCLRQSSIFGPLTMREVRTVKPTIGR